MKSIPKNVLISSILLIFFIFIFVPLVVLHSQLNQFVIIMASLILYGLSSILLGIKIEGLTSGIFIFLIFNFNLPLQHIEGIPEFSVYFSDFLIIIFLGLVCYRYINNNDDNDDIVKIGGSTMLVAAPLVLFLVWTSLSTYIGNGTSVIASFWFFVLTSRYIAIFIVSVIVVTKFGKWHVIFPLISSVFSNLLFALLEIFNQGSFEITYLGEASGKITGSAFLGPIRFLTGNYPGGFVGPTSELVVLALLFLPLIYYVMIKKNTRLKLLGILYFGLIVLLLFIRQSSKGLISLIVVTTIFTIIYYIHRSNYFSSYYENWIIIVVFFSMQTIQILYLIIASSFDQFFTTNQIIKLEKIVGKNLIIRFEQINNALQVIREFPIFGLGGYNTFKVSHEFGGHGIHNTYIAILVAAGIIGLILFYIFNFNISWLTFRMLVGGQKDETILWLILFCGLIGFQLHSLFNANYYRIQATSGYFAYMGIIVGIYQSN